MARSLLRAWTGVHAARPGLWVLACVAGVSFSFGQVEIEQLGVFSLPSPVSILLLLPAAAGIGAAIGCQNESGLPLPDPLRAMAARLLWFVVWTAAASICAT